MPLQPHLKSEEVAKKKERLRNESLIIPRHVKDVFFSKIFHNLSLDFILYKTISLVLMSDKLCFSSEVTFIHM